LKADGMYKQETIDLINSVCEYELVNNKKIIFNKLDDSSNIQDRIFNIAKELNIDYPDVFHKEISKNNFFEIMNIYTRYYDDIQSNIIPKFYLKINKDNFIEVLKVLSEYFPTTGIPNDGWVIVPENEKFIAKLKPVHHLTVDLKHKNGKFFSNRWKQIIVNNTRRLNNNSVYRCYWENNKWIPKEERTDRKYGNNNYIVELITNYLMKGFNIQNFKNNNFVNYYDHNITTPHTQPLAIDKTEFIEYFIFMRQFTKQWISTCNNEPSKCKLLDVGCGKSSSLNMLKELGYKYIVGLDSDPVCIFKSMIISKSNNYIWMDMNNNWNIRDQIKQYGYLWDVSQLYKLKHLYNKFDLILFNFSIFYCEIKNYNILINNLNNSSKKGTNLLFNYINYDTASDKLIQDYNLLRNVDTIKMKLPWKTNTHEEPKFNIQVFSELLKKNNWKLVKIEKINNYYKDYIDWQKLFVYQIWEKT